MDTTKLLKVYTKFNANITSVYIIFCFKFCADSQKFSLIRSM